jgi:hypothetical protein
VETTGPCFPPSPRTSDVEAYTYSVDAFDLANDHSAPSAPVTVTTPHGSVVFVTGSAAVTGGRIRSGAIELYGVRAGDLLVGWFGHRENSGAPPSDPLLITVSASDYAYLQFAVALFRNVATAGALDLAVVSEGYGTNVTGGTGGTIASFPGELVVAAVLTGGSPSSATPGSSHGEPYALDVQNGTACSDLEYILSCASSPQQGSMTLGNATNWYMVVVTFRAS